MEGGREYREDKREIEGGVMTQMREDTPGGTTAHRELEAMNILTDWRSNEFKLNYTCQTPHTPAGTRKGYFWRAK